METKLERIAQIAKANPKERFTSLIHLINKEALMQCHDEMNGRKASGIDEVTKAEYEENLEANVVEFKYRCQALELMSFQGQWLRMILLF